MAKHEQDALERMEWDQNRRDSKCGTLPCSDVLQKNSQQGQVVHSDNRELCQHEPEMVISGDFSGVGNRKAIALIFNYFTIFIIVINLY